MGPLTVGSLFSGIGGFDLGLERAGMRTAWFCESDPFCRRVLAKHWPGVPCYEDVCGLTGASLGPVDVLCGGFPCQDISLAGKGAGIDGSRSGLWSEYARLIGELRPRYVVVENVSALLGRGLDRVLGDLSAFGFDAEWDCIPASAVGAPHQRDRVWLVAYPNRAERREQSFGEPGCGGEAVAGDDGTLRFLADAEGQRPELRSATRERQGRPSSGCTTDVADSDDIGRERAGAAWLGRCGSPHRNRGIGGDAADTHCEPPHGAAEPRRERGQWTVEPDVGRVANGIPARVDRLRSLGNALVPQIAEWIGRRIVEWEAAHGSQVS